MDENMNKIGTSLEQSKKLKELGIDVNTADMSYVYDRHLDKHYGDIPYVIGYKVLNENVDIPCWSLAALLDVLPKNYGRYTKSLYWFDDSWHCEYVDQDGEGYVGETADNPVDACCNVIIKLDELKLL